MHENTLFDYTVSFDSISIKTEYLYYYPNKRRTKKRELAPLYAMTVEGKTELEEQIE
ncbi:MAG: hypothetical protein WCQ23_05205 [Candidatus Methanomethylophilaceae archaeon]